MTGPMLTPAREVAAETFLLGSHLPLPIGNLPVNAFLIRGQQPVLVDTGLPALGEAFVAEVEKLIDLDDLAFIYLTHTDPDHVGALATLLSRAPRARLVTTFQGFGKLSLRMAISPQRLQIVNPGQRLQAGDRELAVLTPPIFDAPETTAFLDTRTRALFSSDAFGGLVPAGAEDAAAVPAAQLLEGMRTWATLDAPWIHDLEDAALVRRIAPMRELAPEVVLSSHLPPARGMMDSLVEHVRAARTAPRWVGPTQDDLMRMAG